MPVETKTTLSEETIAKLQELIQINIDSRDGFRSAAEKTEDLSIRSFFEKMVDERTAQANELARYVSFNGEEPDRSGSFAAGVHRTWMAIRDGLAGDDDYPVLAEAERGEDRIKEAYEDALKCECGSAMNDILMAQYAAVKAAHDRIRDLRDSRQES